MATYNKDRSTSTPRVSSFYFICLLQIAAVGLAALVPTTLLAAGYPAIVNVTVQDGSDGSIFDSSPTVPPNGWNEWSSSFDTPVSTAKTFSAHYKNEMGSNSQVSLWTAWNYKSRAIVTVVIDGDGPWTLDVDVSRVANINVTIGSVPANIGGSASIIATGVSTTISGGSLASGTLALAAEPERTGAGNYSVNKANKGVIKGSGLTTLVFTMAYDINTGVKGGTLANMAVSWMGGQPKQGGGGNISGMTAPLPTQGLFLSGALSYDTIPVANPDPVNPADPAYTVKSNVKTNIGNVLVNDTDIDVGDKAKLTVSSIDTTGTRGIVSNKNDGTFDYDPARAFGFMEIGQTAIDTFLYRANDGQKDSEPAQVTVTVQGGQKPAVDYMDRGFNRTGIATQAVGPAQTVARAAVMLPDGKTVVAGYASNGVNDLALLRYNMNGTLDSTFGAGGVVNTMMNGKHFEAAGLALQADGKLVAVGTTCVAPVVGGGCTNYDALISRFDASGAVDATFASKGTAARDAGSSFDYLTSVAIQADGKVVAAGYYCAVGDEISCSDYDFLLLRYTSTGARDVTFGTTGDGMVKMPIGASHDKAFALALQGNGALVVAGTSCNVANPDTGNCEDASSVLVRFTSAGVLDASFGVGGIARLTTHVGTGLEQLNAVIVQADGKIAAAGTTCVAGDASACNYSDFLLARVDNSGAPDASFGVGGVVTAAVGLGDDAGHALVQQSDGKLLLGGYTAAMVTPNGAREAFALLRFNGNGALDVGFSNDGKVVTKIAADSNDRAYVMATMPNMLNGKVVLAGSSAIDATRSSVAVVSYQILPDTDKDGISDDVDTDDDNDGVLDVDDKFPLDKNESKDNDLDGIGDNADTDDDNDGKLDIADNCPLISNANQLDSDGDGVGDACDNCPTTANADQIDADKNGKGDACETPPLDQDADADGVENAVDNCPTIPNAGQQDSDGDKMGDACDFPPGEPLHAAHFKRAIAERLKACAAAGKPGCK